MLAALLTAVTIALPREGQKLPAVSRTYMIGATNGGETNLVIQGRDVPVHPLGGWVTMIDLTAGTNVIEVGGARRTFTVAAPSAGIEAHSCCERFTKLLAVLGALRCAAPEEDGQRCTEEGQRVESEDEGRSGGRDQHTAERRAHGAGSVDCNGPEC